MVCPSMLRCTDPLPGVRDRGPFGHFRGIGEATFTRLFKSGLRLLGRLYEVKPF